MVTALLGLMITALLGVVWWVITHTEDAERIVSWIYRLFANVSTYAERGHVASDIQATVNTFCSALNKDAPGAVPHKLKIAWVQTETQETFLLEGEVIVRLRHHPDQDRNLVSATMAFLGRDLLTRARTYIDDRLIRSIDLTAARCVLMRAKRPDALTYFHSEILEPDLKAIGGLREDCQVLQALDDEGLFTRVVLRELTGLGDALFPRVPDKTSQDQARRFLNFVRTIVDKERGEDVPLSFIEDQIKIGFVLVARAEKKDAFDPAPFVEAVRYNFRRGAGRVYLCGHGHNVEYARRVARRFVATREGVKEVHEYDVPTMDGGRYRAICVALGGPRRSPATLEN